MRDTNSPQVEYWDSVSKSKAFTHSLNFKWLENVCAKNAKILDVGCGYGRICRELSEHGYDNITGTDFSPEMLRRAQQENPVCEYLLMKDNTLPLPDASFDCALLMAVLTCIPDDGEQKRLVEEIIRVLTPGGILYVSDYPLQTDSRNLERYAENVKKLGTYGVFQIENATATVRHHSNEYLSALFDNLQIIHNNTIQIQTMNGHAASIRQMVLRK